MKNKLRITGIMLFAMLLVLTVIPLVSVVQTTQQKTDFQVIAILTTTTAQTASTPATGFVAPAHTVVMIPSDSKIYTPLTMIKAPMELAATQYKHQIDVDIGTTDAANLAQTFRDSSLAAAETDTHDIQMIVKTMDSGLTRYDNVSFTGITLSNDAGLLRTVEIDSGQTTANMMDIETNQAQPFSQSSALTALNSGIKQEILTATDSHKTVYKVGAVTKLSEDGAVGIKGSETFVITRTAEIGTSFALVA